MKQTSFKPQFHFFVKLGSQVPNSYLSVAVNQMVSGRCPKDNFHSSIDMPVFDFLDFMERDIERERFIQVI